jgi:hypothetical protein
MDDGFEEFLVWGLPMGLLLLGILALFGGGIIFLLSLYAYVDLPIGVGLGTAAVGAVFLGLGSLWGRGRK